MPLVWILIFFWVFSLYTQALVATSIPNILGWIASCLTEASYTFISIKLHVIWAWFTKNRPRIMTPCIKLKVQSQKLCSLYRKIIYFYVNLIIAIWVQDSSILYLGRILTGLGVGIISFTVSSLIYHSFTVNTISRFLSLLIRCFFSSIVRFIIFAFQF